MDQAVGSAAYAPVGAKAIQFLRLPEVMKRVGLGRTKIYDMIRLGEFPAQVRVGRAAVWDAAEVEAWQREVLARGRG